MPATVVLVATIVRSQPVVIAIATVTVNANWDGATVKVNIYFLFPFFPIDFFPHFFFLIFSEKQAKNKQNSSFLYFF